MHCVNMMPHMNRGISLGTDCQRPKELERQRSLNYRSASRLGLCKGRCLLVGVLVEDLHQEGYLQASQHLRDHVMTARRRKYDAQPCIAVLCAPTEQKAQYWFLDKN